MDPLDHPLVTSGFLVLTAIAVGLGMAWRRARWLARRRLAVIEAARDGLGLGVAVVRGDRFIFAHPGFAALAGKPIEALLSDVTPSQLLGAEGLLESARPFESTFVHADGRRVVVESVLRPLQAGLDDRVVLARDITEHRQLLSQMMVTDRMTSVGTLAAGVAHEINNPLACILSNVDSALDDLATVRERLVAALVPQREAQLMVEDMDLGLRDAKAGAQRVREIVRDLRTFARVDGSQRGPVDLGKVLELSAHMASNEIRHRARLVKDWGDLPAVDGNESMLEQVFLNLLVNAAHAIPEGHADANEVRISARRDGDKVLVAVSDTGCGIAEEIRKRIFDPFFTTKAPGVGTGLGLSIVHNTVSALRGYVTVESKVGRGSTFRVGLPASKEKVSAASAPTGTPARRARILVVDDEAPVASAMRRTLRQHDVQVCGSGAEVLDRLGRGERFDVIFCDLMMPEMSGMELYEQMAAQHAEQAARIVFVTGGAFTPAAQAFLNRVNNARLDKPYQTEDLLAQIHRLLEEKPGQLGA